jgi:hypothetical protein
MTIAMSDFLSVAMFAFLADFKAPPPGIIGITSNDLECPVSARYAPPGPLNFGECHRLLSLKKDRASGEKGRTNRGSNGIGDKR